MDKPLTWTGKPVTVSWSGIETWRDCRRKWAYGYIERKRSPNPATELGSQVHDLAEQYLKGNLPWDPAIEDPPDKHLRAWRILEPGLLYAPGPEEIAQAGWGVETWLEGIPCGPLSLVGKVDIHLGRVVVDWKTTGDKDYRWSKTPDQLAEHGQPLLFGYALHHEDPPDTLDFHHINMVTRGKPQAMEVWAYDVPWERAVEEFESAKLIAKDMHDVAKDYTKADNVPATETSCRKFGGCPHAEYCSASPINRDLVDKTTKIQGVTVKQTPIATDRIAALRAKHGIQGTASPVTPEPLAAPPPAQKENKVAKVTGLFQQMLDQQGYVPEGVAKILAESEGLFVSDITGPLALALKDGAFRAKPPKEPEVTVELVWGSLAKDVEKLLGLDQVSAMGGKVMYGLVVPKDWKGSVTEAYQTFLPDSVEAEKAAIIDKVDPPTPIIKTQPPEEVAPAKPRVAAEELATQPAPEPAPEPGEDEDATAASLLVQALKTAGKPLPKSAAASIVKSVIPLQRVRAGRWDSILAASEGQLYFAGNKLALTYDTVTVGGIPSALRGPNVDPFDMPDGFVPNSSRSPFPPDIQAIKDAGESLAAETSVFESPEEPDMTVTYLGPEIFVNCYPSGEEALSFTTWVAQYEAQVTQDYRGKAWPHPFSMPYNDGAKAVVALVTEALNNNGPKALPPTLTVDTSHWLASAVLPLIERLGKSVRVIKAVR